MRKMIYIVLLLAAVFMPVKGRDVGKLQPVEVVKVYIDRRQVVIETDTGDLGMGGTVREALRNLEDTTVGYVYLDTARYLLVAPGAEEVVGELSPYLKKGTRICIAAASIDPAEAASYLSSHEPGVSLGDWESSKNPEKLVQIGERLLLEKKN